MLVIKFHFSRAIRSRIGYLLLILVSNRVLPGVVESQKSAFRVSDPRVSEQPYLQYRCYDKMHPKVQIYKLIYEEKE